MCAVIYTAMGMLITSLAGCLWVPDGGYHDARQGGVATKMANVADTRVIATAATNVTMSSPEIMSIARGTITRGPGWLPGDHRISTAQGTQFGPPARTLPDRFQASSHLSFKEMRPAQPPRTAMKKRWASTS